MHTSSFDVLGRQTADAVTTLGSGVDGTVRRIETAYDTGDRPYLYTSYNAASGGSIVNQVQDPYNRLGQLITEYQSHSGAVNPSSTPNVQYAYVDLANNLNNSRLMTITYPNGRVINYNYNSGLDATISRLSSISDTSATLEAYTYLGLDTVVDRAHPQPNVDLTYITRGGGGDAGDQYTGLDRFGRVVDQKWYNNGTSSTTDEFKYGYDRDSNRLYRTNEVNHNFDELYHANGASNGYDNLNRLVAFARGVLNSTHDTISNPTHSQTWTLDALGNWSSFTSDSTTQTRSHNQQNEIMSISGLTTPGYDANGNTTTDQASNSLAFDAWNRLVSVKHGSTTLESYGFDAFGRRITENPGTARDLYFSTEWQVLEEDVTGSMQDQYVWSPVYQDALIERDTSSQRLYVQQDANWNVTAVIDTSGNVKERYVYDPYGLPTFLTASWATESGSAYGWIYLHQGGRYDTATTLYSFRHRDYSPTLGRWMENDSLGLRGSDGNLYLYVRSAPAGLTDPGGAFAHQVIFYDQRLSAPVRTADGVMDGEVLGSNNTTVIDYYDNGRRIQQLTHGVYISYTGTNASSVHWIQFFAWGVSVYDSNNKYINIGIVTIRTSAGRNYLSSPWGWKRWYIDSRNPADPYYYNELAAPQGTGAGGQSPLTSWIGDKPNALYDEALMDRIYEQSGHRACKAVIWGLFEDYAVVAPRAFGRVEWQVTTTVNYKLFGTYDYRAVTSINYAGSDRGRYFDTHVDMLDGRHPPKPNVYMASWYN